ncbi:hypothetical protein JZU57_02755, partial [bacterium]|nr:hypothetical protein [bacterium]
SLSSIQKKTVYSWYNMIVIDHDFVKTAVNWAIRQTMIQWPKMLRFLVFVSIGIVLLLGILSIALKFVLAVM